MSQPQQAARIDNYTDPRSIFALVEFLASQFAKTIVVFFRCDFGERYFNISDFFGASLTFMIYAGAVLLFLPTNTRGAEFAGNPANSGQALGVFFLCFLLMSIYHRLAALIQKLGGRSRWHSRYGGTSYLRILTALPFVGIYFVQRFVEPLIALVVGSILFNLSPPLGAWFVFAALCLAATEQLAYTRARNRVLDAIDAQIEAEHLGEAISGTKTVKETEGFVLPVPTYFNRGQRWRLTKAMRQLDPALQSIMDASQDAAKTGGIKNDIEPDESTLVTSSSNRRRELDPSLQAIMDTADDGAKN
ncbi:MAG TPA: hypothetical protein VF666_11190 [Pyrinomonadaceae bacterium]|jgi:hypothetical protein